MRRPRSAADAMGGLTSVCGDTLESQAEIKIREALSANMPIRVMFFLIFLFSIENLLALSNHTDDKIKGKQCALFL